MKKPKHGGARTGSGRPKADPEDKKIQITLYFKESDINLFGGKDIVKKQLSKYFENKLNKS